MKFIDNIGVRLGNFLTPHIYKNFEERGLEMPKVINKRYELEENYIWYKGDAAIIADFYKTNKHPTSSIDITRNYFYAHANNEIKVVHSGMPGLISQAMSDLIVPSGFDTKVFIGEEETNDEDKEKLLKDILEDNNFNDLYDESLRIQSWAGEVAWKWSVDNDLTTMPILEVISPLNYEKIMYRNRLLALDFTEDFKEGKSEYTLHEIYSKGKIEYKLFKKNGRKEAKEISLKTTERTAELETIIFDTDTMLADVCSKGYSDFKGIITEFDQLDEAWSQEAEDIRKGKTVTYAPLNKLSDGKLDQFRTNYVLTEEDITEDGKNMIMHIQPDIRVSEHNEAIIGQRDNILANAKLSPLTIGIQDNIGKNASDDALESREVVSLRTREKLVTKWEYFLNQQFTIALILKDYIDDAAFQEYTVVNSIRPYEAPRLSEIVDRVVALKEQDIIDAKFALREVYGESLSDEEIDEILANLGVLTTTEDDLTEE